jgi:myo-inositol-1(or 4)-monophosphatase
LPAADSQRADLARDHALIAQAVREAGGVAMRYFGTSPRSWDKAGDEPVSEADIAINDFLIGKLRKARPDYGWLSEEGENDNERLASHRVFVVDPIDGTRAFLRNTRDFAICVGLVEEGLAVAGAVYNPARDEFFEAYAGHGSRKNGTPCHVGTTTSLQGCRMLAYENAFRHKIWSENWPQMSISNRNSVAYRMMLVACGEFDATFSLTGKNDWDLAAADIIAREAGACVTTARGEPYLYNGHHTRQAGLVCAPPVLHRAIIERVVAAGLG